MKCEYELTPLELEALNIQVAELNFRTKPKEVITADALLKQNIASYLRGLVAKKQRATWIKTYGKEV